MTLLEAAAQLPDAAKSTDWLQGVGQVAQAIIAFLALCWTVYQIWVAQRAAWYGPMRDRMLAILTQATQARQAYATMFGNFPTFAEKERARNHLVALREQISETLNDLPIAFPQAGDGSFDSVIATWRACVALEHTHVVSKNTGSAPAVAAIAAMREYDTIAAAFRSAVTALMKGT